MLVAPSNDIAKFDFVCRWSLLEKYSCKASKLHLKPRRFKIFIETLVSQKLNFSSFITLHVSAWFLTFLAGTEVHYIVIKESQLLKDRKKNVRRRPSQGESSSTAAGSPSSHGRVSTNDSRTVKVVLLDNQDVQKFGSGKGSSIKRHVMGVNRSNAKVDSSVKNARHRRRTGLLFIKFMNELHLLLLWLLCFPCILLQSIC